MNQLTLEPIRRRTVSDRVYEQLRTAIVSGELTAGAELPSERVLCDRLKVNRGAVREALKRLEQSRLIVIHHGESTRVLDLWETAQLDLISHLLIRNDGGIDLEVARSVIELRAAITPDIARLAALRQGPELAPLLEPLIDEMHAAHPDVVQLQQLSERFWRILVRATGNVAYVLVFNTVSEVHRTYSDLLIPLLAKRYRNLKNFEELTRAVIEGDAEAASEVAARHAGPIVDDLDGQIGTLEAEGASEFRSPKKPNGATD
jgi:GntR family transcriptional repressor for pyruvate dehydrogenase complex